jgi:hypothetical protein
MKKVVHRLVSDVFEEVAPWGWDEQLHIVTSRLLVLDDKIMVCWHNTLQSVRGI